MVLFKKLKVLFNKENFDYSQGYVDPFEFHKTFYFLLKVFKVADIDNTNKITFFNQNLVIFMFGFTASILSFISLLHGVDTMDIPHITEAGTYFIILAYKLLMLSCARINLPQYHSLLRTIKKDFEYICSAKGKYRKKFFQNQLTTWKICIVTCIFTGSLAILANVFAFLSLFYYLATYTPGDGTKRPLLFPLWLHGVDLGASPIYEIAFCFLNICSVLYMYNYTFMLQTQIMWVRHITSKVDIVIWSLQDLLVDVHPAKNQAEKEYFSQLVESRLREIVIHHQSMYSLLEDFTVVYKKLLMFEQKLCGPVACLTAYCTVGKLEEGEFNAILAILFIATIVLGFVPSYMGTVLTIKVRSICDACWDIPFWRADPVIRPYMVLIMQRSLRPSPLNVPGFKDVSLETFSKVLASAYSCFNMLRQANK